MTKQPTVPSVSVQYQRTGASTKSNALGMRVMQERAFAYRGEQYLLIKSPPASGKSRALMFIALDKLHNQGLRQAIIVVPEKSIGASFHDEPLSKYGFWTDWTVAPKWNLCNAPGDDNGGKVNSVGAFLESDDRVLVCTHATFRFAVDKFGVSAFDDRLIAVDEFHHVSANPDNKLGVHLGEFMARVRAALRHRLAMKGSAGAYDDGRLHVDLVRRAVSINGEDPKLTPREFDLLSELVTHAGKVLTHRHLLNSVWRNADAADVEALRVHIRNLRQKVEADPQKPALILTELGVGYRYSAPA